MQQKCHSNSLYLIGTVHLDKRAEAQGLYDLLCKLRPQVILVEISPFSVAFRKSHRRQWLCTLWHIIKDWPQVKRRHAAIELLRLQLNMPFEWEIGRLYSITHAIPLIPIDSSALAKEELPLWQHELLTECNLNQLVQQPNLNLETYFADHYRMAQQILCDEKSNKSAEIQRQTKDLLKWMEDEFWQKREGILAKRIERIAKTGMKTTYIGGWMHLIRHELHDTLINRLAPLNPQALLVPRSNKKVGHSV